MSVARDAGMTPTTVAMRPDARVLIAHLRPAGLALRVVTVIAVRAVTRSAMVVTRSVMVLLRVGMVIVVRAVTRSARAVTSAVMARARAAMTTAALTAVTPAEAGGSRSAVVLGVNGLTARRMTVRVTTIRRFPKMSLVAILPVLRVTN